MTDLTVSPASHIAKQRKHTLLDLIGRYWQLYIMIVPIMAYYLIFNYAPLYGLVVAFKNFKVFKGIWGSDWVGLEVFHEVFTDKAFYNVLRNTLIISIAKLLCGFPVPVIFAMLLNEIRNGKYKRIIQTTIYMPRFLSWVTVCGLLVNFLSIQTGFVNEILVKLGYQPIHFMAEKGMFRQIVVLTDIWKGAGWGTIIYLAALTAIDPELFDAAMVDGAGRVRRMWHVTLPGIRPTIIIMIILSMGGIMSAGFDQIVSMYNQTVMEVGDIIDTYVYRIGLKSGRFNYAAAVGIFKSAVSTMLILSANKLARMIDSEQGLF